MYTLLVFLGHFVWNHSGVGWISGVPFNLSSFVEAYVLWLILNYFDTVIDWQYLNATVPSYTLNCKKTKRIFRYFRQSFPGTYAPNRKYIANDRTI